MLISPYFREKEILNVFPMYHMTDYKVNYANHKQFQAGKGGRKQGSPVRIFTSLDPDKVPLPQSENYWFCKRCTRWRSEDNAHCNSCNDCTSKNGTKYWHCDTCNICVKPSWYHCTLCNKCSHPEHRQEHNKDGENTVSKPGPYHRNAKRRKFAK
ncbi:hypothetical protein M8J77_012950 [Diaphorina citri]|nr:hypothetical protein M8J77_012950 [Diaphorina citri]